MNSNQISYFLKIILIVMGVILVSLIFVLIYILINKYKEKNEERIAKKKIAKQKKETKANATSGYNKQSIFNFLEFEKIEDNMIIQKDKRKYLMVIECQGVNYDLMSGIEKVSVEQGFIQFLNTLRQSIQIYTQTRAVNLKSSISVYRDRVNEIERELNKMLERYDQMLHSNTTKIDIDSLQKLQYEITKQRNLYEYGIDIVNNTEKMSLNRNILRKYYYIVVSYYPDEIGKYDVDEIKGMAFSELYANCQSMIQSLGASGVHSKILNSRELAELLYVAYNRDESEDYELEKVLRSGYTELYTTAPDVLEKKMKELDNLIFERARVLANESIREVAIQTKREREVEQKEKQLNNLVEDKAKEIVYNNGDFLGNELVEKSINNIDEKSKKRKEEMKNEIQDGKKRRIATGRRKK